MKCHIKGIKKLIKRPKFKLFDESSVGTCKLNSASLPNITQNFMLKN